jgi:trehalose synthase
VQDSASAGSDLLNVPVAERSLDGFADIAEPAQYQALQAAGATARDRFSGRVIWNVNSTATGGGVAEMLRPLLGYVRGVGVDARWQVLRADPGFFRVTKRIHNHLHGAAGDGGDLGLAERDAYVASLEPGVRALQRLLRPDDLVFLHDPQTAGLVGAVRSTGARAIWRCHIGVDEPNEVVGHARRFLLPFIAGADAYVFSRREHVWPNLDPERVWIVPPSIDPFSPKNRALSPEEIRSIFGRLDEQANQVGGVIPPGAPLVAQVSRWDHLKDPGGVIRGFVDHVLPRHPEAHLALVGPAVTAVSDDPEGATVLLEMFDLCHRLRQSLRSHVHLLSIPMDDVDVNAITVNAIQRLATVVVQKSIAEGFGLTVAEAMWKSRAVVGGRVGGIQDQIDHGVTGLLVESHDLEGFGAAVSQLLDDPSTAARMGERGREHVRREFLGPRHLLQHFDLVSSL